MNVLHNVMRLLDHFFSKFLHGSFLLPCAKMLGDPKAPNPIGKDIHIDVPGNKHSCPKTYD